MLVEVQKEEKAIQEKRAPRMFFLFSFFSRIADDVLSENHSPKKPKLTLEDDEEKVGEEPEDYNFGMFHHLGRGYLTRRK